MSRWTHGICRPCFDLRHPGRVPSALVEPCTEPCCFCGTDTDAGLYVREDPASSKLVCNGTGPAHSGD